MMVLTNSANSREEVLLKTMLHTAVDYAYCLKKTMHYMDSGFVIFADFMSSVQSINGCNLDSDLIQKFLKYYTILAKNGKYIILCWIPSHVGILSNEKADAAAKLALCLSVTPMKLPATDMYPRITKRSINVRYLLTFLL